MTELRDMELFATVVAEGSFAAAARKVELTPAMVGRRIAAMERALGFPLLSRSTRRMQLTPGGDAYLKGCQRILAEVSELEDSVSSQHRVRPAGLIRLSAPDGMAFGNLLPGIITAFRRTWPDIRFDLDLSNAHGDMIADRIDLTLRLAYELQDSSQIAVPLTDAGFGLYAAPEYLERRGRPAALADLDRHDCLHMTASRYGEYWTLWDRDGQILRRYRQDWALCLPGTAALIESVAAGAGIAVIPDLFVENHALAKDLIRLDGVVDFPPIRLFAMYPSRRHLPYRVRLFLDFLRVRLPQAA